MAIESDWERAATGDAFVHGDLRSDNTLITPDDRVVFVDWPSCCVGTPWFDLVAMLPSVELEGGGTPEAVIELAGADIPPPVLLRLVTAIAGYFAHHGRLPDPPGLPTVRAFQRAQSRVTNAWLRRLMR